MGSMQTRSSLELLFDDPERMGKLTIVTFVDCHSFRKMRTTHFFGCDDPAIWINLPGDSRGTHVFRILLHTKAFERFRKILRNGLDEFHGFGIVVA